MDPGGEQDTGLARWFRGTRSGGCLCQLALSEAGQSGDRAPNHDFEANRCLHVTPMETTRGEVMVYSRHQLLKEEPSPSLKKAGHVPIKA